MHASIVVALFAAAAAALPQGAKPSTAEAAATSGGGGSCNLISCVTALGPAGGKCVDFAFGGPGRDCVQGVLDDLEHMPTPCADCLNALFLS
jgi:hypothetical protein